MWGNVLLQELGMTSHFLATGDAKRIIDIWLADGSLVFGAIPQGHSDEIVSLPFSPDN
jgi:hypothetical protein